MIYPTSTSIDGRTLARFLEGQFMTQNDCTRILKSTRLSAVVHRLIGKGWPISSHSVTEKTSDINGRYATFSRYFIEAEDLILLTKESTKVDDFIQIVKCYEAKCRGQKV